MTYITQNGGSLPSRIRGGDSSFWNSQFGTTWPEDTPESPYLIRYFSIRLDSENRITGANVKISSPSLKSRPWSLLRLP